VTEVEMITQKGDYRPKVSTWGMFPRPDNISKAYGGGRTIQKGGEVVREWTTRLAGLKDCCRDESVCGL
jgi:hypothetical protein